MLLKCVALLTILDRIVLPVRAIQTPSVTRMESAWAMDYERDQGNVTVMLAMLESFAIRVQTLTLNRTETTASFYAPNVIPLVMETVLRQDLLVCIIFWYHQNVIFSIAGCEKCKPGWLMAEDKCVDINECELEKSMCGKQQFCVNSEGSYHCLNCDRSCASCTGDGPDMCSACAGGYTLVDNMCVGKQ